MDVRSLLGIAGTSLTGNSARWRIARVFDPRSTNVGEAAVMTRTIGYSLVLVFGMLGLLGGCNSAPPEPPPFTGTPAPFPKVESPGDKVKTVKPPAFPAVK